MTLQINRRLFTVDEYHKLAEVGILTPDDPVELVNGEIIHMSPINSAHAGMVNRLSRILNHLLYPQATITSQNPIKLDHYSEPEPDIVIAKYDELDYELQLPTPEDIFIVMEVSDSTLAYDQSIKTELYAATGIPEYWIVNLVERQVEVYRHPKAGNYHIKTVYATEGLIQAEAIDFSINYTDLFK